MNGVRTRNDRKCYTCNKIFSKKEHLTRHVRGHTKEKPFACSVCGKLYSRSDVLRRHERTHSDQDIEGNDVSSGSAVLTPASHTTSSRHLPGITTAAQDSMTSCASGTELPDLTQTDTTGIVQPMPVGISNEATRDTCSLSESGTWFLEDDFDVGALNFSLTSAISEWAELPSVFPSPGLSVGKQGTLAPVQGSALDIRSTNNEDAVRKKWFTHMSPPRDDNTSRESLNMSFSDVGDQASTNDSYRDGLSQKLRPRVEDEALPSSEQLNLFAKLYFHRFHPLLPVIHAPSFRPTAENALLFLSICSIGSLFVGSSRALKQGSRIFERLNKAILASWESFLSQSHPDAFSMVQAAILGQTYAILAGKPKYLILADVLHGTVVAWAREADRLGVPRVSPDYLLDESDINHSWNRWIDREQRARVQVALHIHDAELATLLHHQPIRSHRFRQFPHLSSDTLFSAPTASRWATLYRQSLQYQDPEPVYSRLHSSPDYFLTTGQNSCFTAYGLLESINARLVDTKQSNEFDPMVCQEVTNLLIKWWTAYYIPAQDLFCLPVLWHSIFVSLYADLDLLEQSIGRDGQHSILETSTSVREWASSLNASRCIIHASLIANYLERMNISSEPAIHVPRALFSAALTYLCVAHHAPQHIICAQAFASPEIKLLGENASQAYCFPGHTHIPGGSVVIDKDHLYRLIDLLQRGGRWGISQTFADVLSTALDEKESSSD